MSKDDVTWKAACPISANASGAGVTEVADGASVIQHSDNISRLRDRVLDIARGSCGAVECRVVVGRRPISGIDRRLGEEEEGHA